MNATYTPNPDGTVGVWNQAINFLGDYTSIRGSAKVKNASEPAAFIVTFDNPRKAFFLNDDFCNFFFVLLVQKGDYNVITSNYVDYALVYACENIPIVEREVEFIWLLSYV